MTQVLWPNSEKRFRIPFGSFLLTPSTAIFLNSVSQSVKNAQFFELRPKKKSNGTLVNIERVRIGAVSNLGCVHFLGFSVSQMFSLLLKIQNHSKHPAGEFRRSGFILSLLANSMTFFALLHCRVCICVVPTLPVLMFRLPLHRLFSGCIMFQAIVIADSGHWTLVYRNNLCANNTQC